MPSASPSNADVVGDEVDGAALGRQRHRQRDRLVDELVFLQHFHAHAEHPVQRAVTAVGDPVAGALAEKVAKHGLDRVDRRGRMDLAARTDDALQPLGAIRPIAVLATVGGS